MKNMNDGITSFKFSQGPKAYKLKRDKVPVIPFLSLSSGGRARRREGQKGRLGKLRVAEDTNRMSGVRPGAPEAGWRWRRRKRSSKMRQRDVNTLSRASSPRTPS